MSIHFIDSASLYQLIELFTKSSVDAELYPWLVQSAAHSTQLLLIQPHIRMSPSSSITGGASGLYEKLTTSLSGIVGLTRPPSPLREIHNNSVLQWAIKDSAQIALAHAELVADQLNFSKWEQWAIENAWIEHGTRNSGLFDRAFIPAISKVLDISEEELNELQRESANQDLLQKYASGALQTRAFRITRNAYAVSALIRGRYHEVTAQTSDSSILHHPMRHGVLSHSSESRPAEYSNTLYFLASIAITSAFAEKDTMARITKYCKNVELLRKCLALVDTTDPLTKLPGSHSTDKARLIAAKFAKDAQIEISSKKVDKLIDAGLSLGGQVIGLFFVPWQSFTASTLGFAVSEDFKSGKNIANMIQRNDHKLLSMTYFGTSGRVWSKPN